MHLRSESIAWNVVGDNVVVLDLATSADFSTNAAGTLLWQVLESGAGRAELLDALAKRFEVGRDIIPRDVDGFLADLDRAQLLPHKG